ncbi:MAG: hypothetical protein ABII82_07945 [Verrucomicrobiota bacterium]
MSSTFGPGKSYAEILLAQLGTVAVFAAEAGARQAVKRLGPRRHKLQSRQPGPETPMWNLLQTQLREALREHGAKTRLARHLGVPKQRLSDFTTGNRRLPDGETVLRILHWLGERAEGRDPAELMPDANPEATRKRLRRDEA